MKKEIKAIIAVVLAVWFFVMGFELGAYKEKKAQSEVNTVNPITTTAPSQTTEPTLPPVTENPTEPSTNPTLPSDPGEDNTTTKNDVSDEPSVKDPLNLSKQEIIAEVNKYVNQVKKEQNMSASASSVVNIEVTECSAQGFVNTLNNIISGITEKFGGEEAYTFVNGQATDADGNTVTPWDVIPPTHKDFSALDAGVASAKVEKVGANTVYTITMIVEDTTMESPVPAHNSTVIGYLDLAGIDLPITLTKANMHYPGSTVSVTVNPDGKVVEIVNKLPMEGTGATKFIGKEVFASFAGALDEKWTFTY